ncbi:Endoribonuclease YbeY [Trichinella spiralis]|uniref:Endoribonuclease YbeY n=1 Tax=Trichinella spiralis TaxID=6334 RepID=A0ABR3KSH9_TRISP
MEWDASKLLFLHYTTFLHFGSCRTVFKLVHNINFSPAVTKSAIVRMAAMVNTAKRFLISKVHRKRS